MTTAVRPAGSDRTADSAPGVPSSDVPARRPLRAERHSPRAFDSSATVTADQLTLLLDAACCVPSVSNTQPWRFLAGRRGERAFDALLPALTPANQALARDAAALVLVAAETADDEGTPRPWAVYDTGQAAGHLMAQATALGLSVRQMGGFIPADLPALPEHVTPLVVIAVGVPQAPDAVPDDRPA
jgi:nitroreductase